MNPRNVLDSTDNQQRKTSLVSQANKGGNLVEAGPNFSEVWE
ncbi:hypothetical protein COLO4_25399 [Corchorus olitorius]|uniref:Uncharacterized protein n=1 Tax=Corchorus olitorius TaxID=93759 RepID=A0A1R3I363_9ROSI|nr:hypothetical protein COLO4_25399 [Corchorus olitorius]